MYSAKMCCIEPNLLRLSENRGRKCTTCKSFRSYLVSNLNHEISWRIHEVRASKRRSFVLLWKSVKQYGTKNVLSHNQHRTYTGMFCISGKATDGDTRKGLVNCASTAADTSDPWWAVDLGADYFLTKALITNRQASGQYTTLLYYFTLLDTAVVRLFAFQPVVSCRCSCFNIVAQVTL